MPLFQSGRTQMFCPALFGVDVPTRLVSDKHAHGSPAGLRVRQPSGSLDAVSALGGDGAGVVEGEGAGDGVAGGGAGCVIGGVGAVVGGVSAGGGWVD